MILYTAFKVAKMRIYYNYQDGTWKKKEGGKLNDKRSKEARAKER